jgi:aspartate 1-decarboxylase
MSESQLASYTPRVVLLGEGNSIKAIKS